MSTKTLIHYKPVTSSLRGLVLINKKNLWKGGPKKSLTEHLKKTGGRNNQGRITCRTMSGGAKRTYRKIDFYRKKDGIFATVERIEYDPNRTAFIALIKYDDGEYSYITAPEGVKIGTRIVSGDNSDILPGNALKLEHIPSGTHIHNVELQPGKGGKLGRTAGGFITLMGKELGYAILLMPSSEIRKVSLKCKATVGTISNAAKFNENLAKAGRNRWRGKKPLSRAVAKNPVDHHNGGRTSGGKVFGNRTGHMKKGQRTRDKSKTSSSLIIQRRGRK